MVAAALSRLHIRISCLSTDHRPILIRRYPPSMGDHDGFCAQTLLYFNLHLRRPFMLISRFLDPRDRMITKNEFSMEQSVR